MIKVKWLVTVVGFMLLAVMMHGCAVSERTGGNLGLAGYKSVEVAEVKVDDGVPFAADKLSEKVRQDLNAALDQNQFWARDGRRKAKLTVVITGGRVPTENEERWGLIPHQLAWTLQARDAETGADLGAISHITRLRTVANPLIDGSVAAEVSAALRHHQLEGQRHRSVEEQAIVEIDRSLNDARRRAAVVRPSPFVKPEPALAKPSDQSQKHQLASSVPPNRS